MSERNLLEALLSEIGISPREAARHSPPASPNALESQREQASWQQLASWALTRTLRNCIHLDDHWRVSLRKALAEDQGLRLASDGLPSGYSDNEALTALQMLWLYEIIEACWHEACHALAAEEEGLEWTITWRRNGQVSDLELTRAWGLTSCQLPRGTQGSIDPQVSLSICLAPAGLTILDRPGGRIQTELSEDDLADAGKLIHQVARARRQRRLWPFSQSHNKATWATSGDARWPHGSEGRQRLAAIARRAFISWPHTIRLDDEAQADRQQHSCPPLGKHGNSVITLEELMAMHQGAKPWGKILGGLQAIKWDSPEQRTARCISSVVRCREGIGAIADENGEREEGVEGNHSRAQARITEGTTLIEAGTTQGGSGMKTDDQRNMPEPTAKAMSTPRGPQ